MNVSCRKAILAGFLFAGLTTAVIALTATRLQPAFTTVGTTRPFQYPWRLTTPDQMAQLTAWLGYSFHNLSAWLVIWLARRQQPSFSDRFNRYNWSMITIHILFAALHLLQTHLWYDGLARDVPEITALGSVALMLMVVLILENPRRGILLGWRAPFSRRLVSVVKEYHGYLFTWALTYTFWYHPTEDTPGHLHGFLYILLLIWQSALLFHRAHLNRWWKLTLEVLVLPHGALVAYYQQNQMWPMFAFGFGAMFFLTQMYGLPLRTLTRRLAWASFLLLALATYGWRADSWQSGLFDMAAELPRIPFLEYTVVLILFVLFAIVDRIWTTKSDPAASAVP